jgi:mono/diheme cytochrome c family protein
MKTILMAALVVCTAVFFANCTSSKKVASVAAPAVTYTGNVEQLLVANCSPCHFPAKGGNKLAFDNVANARDNIDNLISRIEMHPGDRGFMPFKRDRLSDSVINVFKQWKADGLADR